MALVFKINVKGSSKPPIWRKVKVNESATFDEFHLIIQVLFGLYNQHMYQFSPKGYGSLPSIRYNFDDELDEYFTFSNPESFPHDEYYDAEKIRLENYFHLLNQKMVYIYDFGDDWTFIIELVDITDETLLYPMCIGAKGSNLEEDVGGIWGFYNMEEALNDPKHPEYKYYREWLQLKPREKWDGNPFDIDKANETLIKVWKALKSQTKEI